MGKKEQSIFGINLTKLRDNASFFIVFFLVATILISLVVIPKINESFEAQHGKDLQIELELEAELFIRFVESQRSILDDLSKFPVLTNAVMLSNGENADLSDLFNNFLIGGEKSRLVLQDIGGNILIKTMESIKGSYSIDEEWVQDIFSGTKSSHFQLLGQQGKQLIFLISVPIKYRNNVEGLLSAEIMVPLDKIFVTQSFDDDVAFKIIQDNVTVKTDFGHIELPHEISFDIEKYGIKFVYISDNAPIKAAEEELRNIILIVLLIGLVISFILFFILGYSTLADDEESATTRKTILRRAYILPATVAFIGIAATISAYKIVQYIQQESIEAEFIADSKSQIKAVSNNIESGLEVLHSIKAFYDASSFVDREEFNTFTTPLLNSNTYIHAMSWTPNLAHSKREEFEKLALKDGINNFKIKEKNADGEMIESPENERYLPVYYIEPIAKNEKALGFNLASNAKRLEALNKARDSGKKVATAPIELVQETENQVGVLVFYPVYNKATAYNSVKERQENLRGYVTLVLRTTAMVNSALEDIDEFTSVHILDISDANNPQTIFGEAANNAHSYSQVIDMGGRKWKVNISPKKATIVEDYSIIPWFILGGGIAFSIFISFILIQQIRRREVVEGIVEERTRELSMLGTTVNNANDIFIITEAKELDADKGGPKIIYVNEAFARVTGYTTEDAIGNTPRMLQGEKTDRGVLDDMRASIEKGERFLGEIINYTKEGKEYWVELNISPIKGDDGEILYFAAVEKDITERKTAEIERELLVDKLSESNEELARFAYVASHDLQEPLRMVRNFTELLEKKYADKLDDTAKKYIHMSSSSAARMQDLVQDLLEYARVTEEAEVYQKVDCNKLMAIIEENLGESIKEAGAEITYDELPSVMTNPVRMTRVIQNLVGNGIKYQHKGSTPKVHISVDQDATDYIFCLKDNGIGMNPEYCEKIFLPFQRLHRKDEYVGTGIGLAICAKILEKMGGRIWAESALEKGSQFYFTIPRQKSQ